MCNFTRDCSLQYMMEQNYAGAQRRTLYAVDQTPNSQQCFVPTPQRNTSHAIAACVLVLDARSSWPRLFRQQPPPTTPTRNTYAGDIVIASGTLSYLGPFTAEYRTRIADGWVQVLRCWCSISYAILVFQNSGRSHEQLCCSGTFGEWY